LTFQTNECHTRLASRWSFSFLNWLIRAMSPRRDSEARTTLFLFPQAKSVVLTSILIRGWLPFRGFMWTNQRLSCQVVDRPRPGLPAWITTISFSRISHLTSRIAKGLLTLKVDAIVA
jgi:hypothetical protein